MGKGRPTYISQVAEALEDAVEALGEIRASGHQRQELDGIYERLLGARQKVKSIWDNEAHGYKPHA